MQQSGGWSILRRDCGERTNRRKHRGSFEDMGSSSSRQQEKVMVPQGPPSAPQATLRQVPTPVTSTFSGRWYLFPLISLFPSISTSARIVIFIYRSGRDFYKSGGIVIFINPVG